MEIIILENMGKRTAKTIISMQEKCLPGDVPLTVDRPQDIWFLMVHGNKNIGFASLTMIKSENIGYLSRAGILPQFQGQGYQKNLILERVKFSKSKGLCAIITDCTAENAPSANSLISCGFKVYNPEYKWALPSSIYWKKALK